MTQLPHAFKRIRLELARSKEFPNGSANHGYELVAPLDADANIDAVLWQKYRDNCRVNRFWGNGEEIGYLLHKPGGPEHARWVFDYHKTGQHEDEYGYRLGTHAFRFGEYVSIQDKAGEIHTFRVVSVVLGCLLAAVTELLVPASRNKQRWRIETNRDQCRGSQRDDPSNHDIGR